MKKIVSIFLGLFILSSGFKMNNTIDTNAKIKAVFIYNFTKYIEWPAPYKEGDFTIGVIGETSLYSELIKMTETKKVANQTLDVKKYNSLAEVSKCHILYVCKDKSDQLSEIVKKIKNNSTLIVTEENGLADKGAGINFIIKENRQKFELNKGNVEKYKLKVSSNLEALAFTVK
ncbi:MAG: YfiR family protein [Flavobacteriales bacterium]|nr:YfiR family protein [Flavobacteriales bacterium]